MFYTKYLSYERAMKLNLEKINKVQRKKKKSEMPTELKRSCYFLRSYLIKLLEEIESNFRYEGDKGKV